MPPLTETIAIVGCIIAVGTFSVQIYGMFKERKKEQREIDVALDHQPEIKEQLELGNIGAAVQHLNAIILSQANHIDRLEKENADLRTENADLLMRLEHCERILAELQTQS